MKKNRQKVDIVAVIQDVLAETHFKIDQLIPAGIIVRKNRKDIMHYHSYGGISPFFKGLTEKKLLGTACPECFWNENLNTRIWLPPRTGCPDCWKKMTWVEVSEIYTQAAKVYTDSMTNYPGAGFMGTFPCPLISIEIPGVWTKMMGFMSEFGEGEPYIGQPIKPVFRTENPTYTILDLSWVPID